MKFCGAADSEQVQMIRGSDVQTQVVPETVTECRSVNRLPLGR